MRIRLALLLTLLAGPVSAAPSTNETPSVDLPEARPLPDEVAGDAARRLGKVFNRALEALDDGRWTDAADGFEAVLADVEWPEASYNAALARYHLLDLLAAERHAATAASLLDDARSHWLHAVVLGAIGRHGDAADQARAAAERTDDAELRARSLLQQAVAARLAGRHRTSLEAASAARDLGVTVGDPLVTTAAWLAMAQASEALGDGPAARTARAEAGALTVAAPVAGHELAFGRAEEAWRKGAVTDARQALAGALTAVDADATVPPLTRAGLLVRAAPLLWSLGDREGARARLAAADQVLRPAGARAAAADIDVIRSSWAVAGGDVPRAAALLDAAIDSMQGLQVPGALASARLARAQIRAEEGDVRGAIALAEQAREEIAAHGHADGLPGALLVSAELLGRGGALADALAVGREAITLATQRESPRLEAAARAEVAVILARMGAVDEAARNHSAATAHGGLLAVRSRVRLEVELARGFARRDRLDEGLRHANEAVALAGDGPDTPADLKALAEEAVVAVLLEGGRHDDAERFVTERGIDDPRITAAVADRQGTALYNAGVDAYTEGDYVSAVTTFEQIVRSGTASEQRKDRARRAIQRAYEASGVQHLEVGAVKQADKDLARAAEVAVEVQDPEAEARANLLRAQIALEGGHPERAADLGARSATTAVDDVVRAEAWELVGLARIDTDPDGARRAFEDALLAWGTGSQTVARRATLTYNLAVLEQTGDPVALRARLKEAAALAGEAGDDALKDEITAWLTQLESDDE